MLGEVSVMSCAPRLGVVTIGQSPRTDMVPEMARWLGEAKIVERGALDGLSPAEISALRPVTSDYTLVTRLRDGTSAVVAKRHIVPRIQQAIDDLERTGVDATVLVCTGTFPPFSHHRPLLFAERLLVEGVRAVAGGSRLGVICPLSAQEGLTREKWEPVAGEVYVASASPYDNPGALEAAARVLKDAGVDYVVLDCMGYTQAMKEKVRLATGVPVLLARSIVARLVAEVLS